MASLDDKTTPKTGVAFTRYRRGAKEARDRRPVSDKTWAAAWEARKAFAGFGEYRLEIDDVENAILMEEGHSFLGHKVVLRWIETKSKKQFPKKEFVRCLAWAVNDKGEWVATGEECPTCKVLGHGPIFAIYWPILDGRTFKDRETGKNKKWGLKWMCVAHDQIQGNILDGVEIAAAAQGVEPKTAYAMFQVSRSGGPQSRAYGTSWTYLQHAPPAEFDEVKEAAQKLPSFEECWPLFKGEDLNMILRKHMKICLDKDLPLYDEKGVIEVLGDVFSEEQDDGDSRKAAIADAGLTPSKSLDGAGKVDTPSALDAAAMKDNKPAKLSDMDDPVPGDEEPKKEDTDFNPWEDEQV